MLELARINPSRNATEPWTGPAARVLVVGLARTAEEIEQIQRLRYDVFTEDMGAELVAFLARVVERTAERWPVL